MTDTKELDMYERIAVRTRTGKETHSAIVGVSITDCGKWLKADSRRFRVYTALSCEKCLAAEAAGHETKREREAASK
jgi:hypothetical protein